MHYFNWNIGDYAIATRHLSDMEDLAYRRMIEVYFDKETPLPTDVAKVARLIRLRDFADEVKAVLDEFFEKTKEGFVHSRIETDISAYQEKAKRARNNGKLGGRPKKTDAPAKEESAPRKAKAPAKVDDSPVMAMIPLTGDKQFELKQSQTDKWTALYPSVNLQQEVNKMIGWLDANPSKRKTPSGIVRFMNNWLSKAQDSGVQPAQQKTITGQRTAQQTEQFVDELEDQYQRSQAAKARLAARNKS